jgi:putative flippase GtrA
MSVSGFGPLSRFGVAGAVNTAVGLAVIYLLDVGLGIDPRVANAVGYAVGMCFSFALNRSFVFRHDGAIGVSATRYAVVVATAFLLNQCVLVLTGLILGDSTRGRLLAQLSAMISYTATVFLLSRLWAFKNARAAP